MTILLTLWATSPQTTGRSVVPANLRPPAEQQVIFKARARGHQIYVCTAATNQFVWKLKAPEAKLLTPDGGAWGRHFAGPTWQAKDGSQVRGKVVATLPSPEANSIPWLLLEAVQHEGKGVFGDVLTIQRLHTQGGAAPGQGCDAEHTGVETQVPYEAEYYFYAAPQGSSH